MHDLQLITVDDNTCITANGKLTTNIGADNTVGRIIFKDIKFRGF